MYSIRSKNIRSHVNLWDDLLLIQNYYDAVIKFLHNSKMILPIKYVDCPVIFGHDRWVELT